MGDLKMDYITLRVIHVAQERPERERQAHTEVRHSKRQNEAVSGVVESRSSDDNENYDAICDSCQGTEGADDNAGPQRRFSHDQGLSSADRMVAAL